MVRNLAERAAALLTRIIKVKTDARKCRLLILRWLYNECRKEMSEIRGVVKVVSRKFQAACRDRLLPFAYASACWRSTLDFMDLRIVRSLRSMDSVALTKSSSRSSPNLA